MNSRTANLPNRNQARYQPAISILALPGTGRRRAAAWLARLWRARDGATAIEMAFLLPVFMLFLLGICEFGRALWTQTALQFAVEAAARCAAISPSLCTAAGGGAMDIPGYAASQAFGLSIPASAFIYQPNAVCGVGSGVAGSGGAQVTASYAFQAVVPQLVPVDVTLSAKSCHP